VIAFVDGFWVTSLQGAVGAIERRQPPFHRWLRDATMMLPIYVAAVVGAAVIARRLVGRHRSALAKFGATALLVTVVSCGVGIAEVAASSAYDYHLQTTHIALSDHLRHQHTTPATPAAAGTCTGTCAERQATFNVHVRAVTYASLVMLITNAVLVLWMLVMFTKGLWLSPLRREYAPKASQPVGAALA